MIRLRSVVRDLVLLCLAVAIGWWVRGSDLTVLAKQRSSSSSSSSARGSSSSGDSNLAFQMMGDGPNAALVLYNSTNHELYVYERAGGGNSMVSCTYSFAIPSPGGAIRRDNCPVGQLTESH